MCISLLGTGWTPSGGYPIPLTGFRMIKKPSLLKNIYVLLTSKDAFPRPFTLNRKCFKGDFLNLLSPKPELRRLNFRHQGNVAEWRDLHLAERNLLPRPRDLFQ